MQGEQYFCNTAQHALDMKAVMGNKVPQLTKREKQHIELANSHPSLEFISQQLGEDLDSTAAFYRLLVEKIDFYNMDVDITVPSGI